jgi:hypothetical protein
MEIIYNTLREMAYTFFLIGAIFVGFCVFVTAVLFLAFQ